MSEVEIRDVLKDQGVVGVNLVTLKKEGKEIPTNTLFLTFGSQELPKEITVSYLKVKVALFVPNPMRCSTATSLATRANVARLLRSVRIAEKISMKVNVRDSYGTGICH